MQSLLCPTYAFVVTIFGILAIGIFRYLSGSVVPVNGPVRLAELQSTGEVLGLVLLLKAFAAGCTAFTGIEAISDGVPAFKKPEWVNARATLTIMAVLLTSMFLGISFLAQQYHALPPEPGYPETVLSQIGRGVFGGRGVPICHSAGGNSDDPGSGSQHSLFRLPAPDLVPGA